MGVYASHTKGNKKSQWFSQNIFAIWSKDDNNVVQGNIEVMGTI